MARRRLIGALAVAGTALFAGGTAPQAATTVSAHSHSTIMVKADKLEAFGDFYFDPVLQNGKFIIGELSCAAVGTNVRLVAITKCYIVAASGQDFIAKASQSTTGATETVATFKNQVPAVNLTQCETVVAFFKDNTEQVVHLASAPKGQPVQTCNLG